ncbi:MAG: class I SAM-dependent methyltransferase [Desulfobacterales bacterium]|nr:class I SAM-dependent methyltransferase [Desulfobacterales bacterium]
MNNLCCKCGLDKVLENTLHPGGLKLTERLAEVSMLKPGCKVLEIGCGKGITTLFLARNYGCSITGIDISPIQIASARERAKDENIVGGTNFIAADCQELPLFTDLFDMVFSECSISLVQNKKQILDEIWRVLKPGGRLTITDLIRSDNEVTKGSSFALFPCIDNAESLKGYRKLLKNVGFQDIYTEDCSTALKEAFFRMRLRFGRMDTLWKEIGCACDTYPDPIPTDECQKQRRKTGIGYALITATKE